MKNLLLLITVTCLSSYFCAANSITTSSVTGGPFCGGDVVKVSFTVDSVMNSGNVFTAQLSDKKGNFDSEIAIGSLSSTNSGTITANIPQGMPTGSDYKIRVVSSNPSLIGTPSPNNIRINPAPKGLIITNVTSDGFTLSWNSVSTAAYYQVTGKLHNSQRYPQPVDITDGSLSYTFTGLKSGHDFDLGVRAICTSGDKSSWNPITASTDSSSMAACETPTSFFVSVIGVSTSSLEWGDVAGAMDYSFRYRAAGATDWIYMHPTESHMDLTGLLPAQDYEAQVASRCSESDSSAYGNTATWQTNYFRLANAANSSINIYPNPSNGNFTVSFSGMVSNMNFDVTVQNVVGQVIYQSSTTIADGSREQNISLTDVNSGVYFINVKAGNEELHSSLVIQ
ncbi:MAG: fibronectin type III domain-containing protein [Chitinophagales bacterium]|nr:fibronectin type III domain-containing protein [Chitinophagales bacterium]